MAKRNRTGLWIVVASVVVLGFVGILFLNEQSEEVTSASDITPDMTLEATLQITEDVCMGAAARWRDIANAGNDDSGIPAAVIASRRCERDAAAVLAQAPSNAWANAHCKAVVEGWRDVAIWQIEQGPNVSSIDMNLKGPVSGEVANQSNRGLALMEAVQYHRRMCVHQGVVG